MNFRTLLSLQGHRFPIVLLLIFLFSRTLSSALAQGGGYTTLNYPGSAETYAYGVNDAGAVVGFYHNGIGYCGFLLQNGVYTSIVYPGVAETFVCGINNAGAMVGSYYDGTQDHGFVLENGVYTALNFPVDDNTVVGHLSC